MAYDMIRGNDRIRERQCAATLRNVADALEMVLPRFRNPKVDPAQSLENIIAHMRRDADVIEAPATDITEELA